MSTKNIYFKLLGTISVCSALVVLLFLSSEKQVHRNNAFTRRFPPHPVSKHYDLDLGYNSYYIAGCSNKKLYLGNRTAPWHILEVNPSTRDTCHIRLEPNTKELKYRSLKVNVLAPYFFMMDGTIPLILRGKTGDWKAYPWMAGQAYFNKALAIDSNKIFIRTISAKSQKTTLGLIEEKNGFHVKLDTTLLVAQNKGLFDVDGIPIKGNGTDIMGYVHYYRNEFLTMNQNLDHVVRHRTIDTVEKAQIQVTPMDNNRNFQMSAPPTIINKTATVYKDLVLIRSDRLGRNESEDMLDQAAIIDVYNTEKQTYEFSFYLYDINKHKIREFIVDNGLLIGLVDDRLTVYHLEPTYFEAKSIDQNERTPQISFKETTGP
ncbi:hypothetical protein [Flagellimonas iocasae]|uniref:Uncharacterized protein n=1 Tax=Flagellimonas iocasae TaxID=2055905 RepID=A0ABW4Y432_9FLAO